MVKGLKLPSVYLWELAWQDMNNPYTGEFTMITNKKEILKVQKGLRILLKMTRKALKGEINGRKV